MCKNCANLMYISQILNFNEEHSNMPEAVVQRCSVKKNALRSFTKLTGKHLPQSLFF